MGTNYGSEREFTTTTTPAAPIFDHGIVTTDATPALSGTAAAGATVSIKIDDAAAVTVTASATGAWNYTVPTALATGLHTVKITTTDSEGFPSSPSYTLSIIAPTGYAAATTGGSSGTSVEVTTRDDFIKYATDTNSYVITVSGQLTVGTVEVAFESRFTRFSDLAKPWQGEGGESY